MNNQAFARAGLLVLLLSALLWAGDPWKEKPYTAWTDKEVEKILSNSPWAKKIEGYAPNPSIPTTPKWTANRPIPQGTDPRSQLTHLFTVVWLSARTIREAEARRGQLQRTLGKEPAGQLPSPEHYYVIAARGPHALSFSLLSPEVLRQSAYLQVEKRKILPARLEFTGYAGQGLEVRFYFPREVDGQPVIGSKHKKVKFHSTSQFRPFTVTFELPRMRRNGVPDL